MPLNWNIEIKDAIVIDKIVERARQILPSVSKRTLAMDITATHLNGCRLDLKKLLEFPDFDFVHDVVGIHTRIDRWTGELQDCFLPRSAR